MTTAEYAAQVRQLIERTAQRTPTDPLLDDHRLGYAFEVLAKRSVERCEGPGREYEVSANRQAFETRSLAAIVEDAREEALDIPAYLTQLAIMAGVGDDSELQEGIALSARLVVLLDRLEHRLCVDPEG